MHKQLKTQHPNEKTIRQICNLTGLHRVTATVLANRGITSQSQLSAFLNPSLNHLRSFEKLIDMDKAVCRITDAIINREKILVFGDYDVDGITSVTILYEFLTLTGANVSYYIPHRVNEGYSLKIQHISGVAIAGNINLIVTTDCGSASHEAVKCANQSGIDVIVTDHHTISSTMPDAFAIVNPRRNDCPSGSGYLAGVGVVFYLLITLRKHLRDINFWNGKQEPNLKNFCDLVALGTISDIVPLVNENRIITKAGLDVINTSPRTGIKALIDACGINKPFIDAEDIAFKLAPRLNAAGRMDHAMIAIELLSTKDADQAKDIAEKLNLLNSNRQLVENKILQFILMYFNQEPQNLNKKTIVFGNHGWHAGVLGIVASKLVDKFFRPVVLISIKDGIGKGSARSIPGINLYDALGACSEFLENFGGHPMAGGIEIKGENIKPFAAKFERTVREMSTPDNFLPEMPIDCELEFDMISDQLINELESLHPFGHKNPEPVFLSNNVIVAFSKIIGNDHLRLSLKQRHSNSNKIIPGIWFNAGKEAQDKKYFNTMAYTLKWNYWNGNKTLQAVIKDA